MIGTREVSTRSERTLSPMSKVDVPGKKVLKTNTSLHLAFSGILFTSPSCLPSPLLGLSLKIKVSVYTKLVLISVSNFPGDCSPLSIYDRG